MDREVEEKEEGEHRGKAPVGQEGEKPVAFREGLLRGPAEQLPGSEEDKRPAQQENCAARHEGIAVADDIGHDPPDPWTQGHAEENRHLHEPQRVSQPLPRDNRGDQGDGGRNGSRLPPREETEEEELPNVGDEAHREGYDGAAEHGPLHHDLPPMPVREPSPERGEEGHEKAAGSRHGAGPDGNKALVCNPQLPDIEGEKRQHKGKANHRQELGGEHDVEGPLPGLPSFRRGRVG